MWIPILTCTIIGAAACVVQYLFYLLVCKWVSYSELLAFQFFVLWMVQSVEHYKCWEKLKIYISCYG